jgi:hypothetical protein
MVSARRRERSLGELPGGQGHGHQDRFSAKTKDKEAEHLVVVILGRPEFIEAVFARFRMRRSRLGRDYSHRIYGKKIGTRWRLASKNGADTEKP